MSEQQCTYCGFADPLLYQGGDDRYYCDDVDECRERAGAYIATLQRELVEAKERIALRDSIIPDLAAHIERLQSCERSMREALQRIGDPDFEYCSDEDEDTQLSMRMADARAVLNGIANRPSAPRLGEPYVPYRI